MLQATTGVNRCEGYSRVRLPHILAGLPDFSDTFLQTLNDPHAIQGTLAIQITLREGQSTSSRYLQLHQRIPRPFPWRWRIDHLLQEEMIRRLAPVFPPQLKAGRSFIKHLTSKAPPTQAPLVDRASAISTNDATFLSKALLLATVRTSCDNLPVVAQRSAV